LRVVRFGRLGVRGVVSLKFPKRCIHALVWSDVLTIIVGIDMFIEYTYQNFNKKIVEVGCAGLDLDVEGRTRQFYKGELQMPGLGL
jgi:hypothetical protein